MLNPSVAALINELGVVTFWPKTGDGGLSSTWLKTWLNKESLPNGSIWTLHSCKLFIIIIYWEKSTHLKTIVGERPTLKYQFFLSNTCLDSTFHNEYEVINWFAFLNDYKLILICLKMNMEYVEKKKSIEIVAFLYLIFSNLHFSEYIHSE